MLIHSPSLTRQLPPLVQRCAITAIFALILPSASWPVRAQTFNSGSTEANGAFAPTQSQEIQVPKDGVFNYTTVTIPSGVRITFKPNSRNTPVTILATGDVRIAGSFSVNGISAAGIYGGRGGPGGFRGGDGGVWLNDPSGKAGEGPGGGGGGKAVADGSDFNGGGGGGFFTPGGSGEQGGPSPPPGGPAYGAKVLLPLIGGSGGGGGSARLNNAAGGGGGGGGAILIASSTRIIFEPGWQEMGIYSIGGDAGASNSVAGGAGSGGAIRIVANTISGFPKLWAYGGSASGCCGNRGNFGGLGIIRAEADDLSQLQVDSRGNNNFSFGRPNPVTLPNNPGLRIVSVGGVNAPDQPAGSFYTAQPDLVVSESVANPMNVVIQATNIPGAPVVQVTRINDAGQRATDTCTLSNNTCTARVSLPLNKTSLIIASVTVDSLLAFGRPMFIDGERVDKVEIAAAFGGESELTYITQSGRRLKWPR